MSLDPRAIALQGIGFPSRLVALQGFSVVDVIQPPGGSGPDSGRARRIRTQNQALIAALTAMAAQGAFN